MARSHHRTSPLWLIVLAYAATVAIWGTTWLAIKFSLQGVGPITGVGLRFIVASIALATIGAASGAYRARPAGGWQIPLRLVLVLATCLFGLNYVLTYVAETHLSSGLVAVLFGLMPFFVFGFSHVMLGEAITWKAMAGALFALLGVGVISLVGNVRGDLFFVGAAIAASIISAFANAYLKKWSHAEPFVVLPIAMLVSGAACAAAGVTVEGFHPQSLLQPAPLLAIGYLAVFGSAISFYLMHWCLQRIDSSVYGLSALMIPVIAVVVGIVFGGEAFSVRDLIGALLVIGGVWLSLASRGSEAEAPEIRAA